MGQWFTLCRRLVTQGLQGLPLYQARIFASVFITLVYGGSYFGLNYSWRGAEERTTVLFIVAAVLPALAIGTLPFYNNGVLVCPAFSSTARNPRASQGWHQETDA